MRHYAKTRHACYKKAEERSEKKTAGKRSHTEIFPCDQMTSPEDG